MARLYDWEALLRVSEREHLASIEARIKAHKNLGAAASAQKDELRRKCVQRARNALNKQGRAALREKG